MEHVINFENMFSFPSEDIRSFLQKTIDDEIRNKKGNADFDLVEECILLLELIFEEEICSPSQSFVDESYVELLKLCCDNKKNKAFIDEIDETYEAFLESEQETGRKRINFKKTLLIAAIVAASIFGSVIAGANDMYTSFSSNLFGISFKDLFKHDVYTDGNITYINQNTDESKYYSSVEDFVKGENIQGLSFSEKLEIKEIMYSEIEGNKKIIFNPVDRNTYFSINANTKDIYGLELDPTSYAKTKTKSGIDVWVYEKANTSPEKGTTQVMFKINQWYYCIHTSYPENAIELIDNFKEI